MWGFIIFERSYMNCIEQQGSSWNNGGIITNIYPVQKTIDDSVDNVELVLDLFTQMIDNFFHILYNINKNDND